MITVSDDVEEALKAGWIALQERAPGIEGFRFDGFRIRAFKEEKTVIGMLLTKGPELHVAILSEYRNKWLSRRLIKEVLKEIIDTHGYATTSVMKDNLKGQDFVKRIGFIQEHEENGVIYYRYESPYENSH